MVGAQDWSEGHSVFPALDPQINQKGIHKSLLSKRRAALGMAAFTDDFLQVADVLLCDADAFGRSFGDDPHVVVIVDVVVQLFGVAGLHLPSVSPGLGGGEIVIEIFGFDVVLADFASDLVAADVIRPKLLAVVVDLEGGDPAPNGLGWWLIEDLDHVLGL